MYQAAAAAAKGDYSGGSIPAVTPQRRRTKRNDHVALRPHSTTHDGGEPTRTGDCRSGPAVTLLHHNQRPTNQDSATSGTETTGIMSDQRQANRPASDNARKSVVVGSHRRKWLVTTSARMSRPMLSV